MQSVRLAVGTRGGLQQNDPETGASFWPEPCADAFRQYAPARSFGVRSLAGQFHWTRTQIATALAISQLRIAFTCSIWGVLTDRFGPRRVILESLTGMSAAYASLTLHLWHFYLVLPYLHSAAEQSPRSAIQRCSYAFSRHT